MIKIKIIFSEKALDFISRKADEYNKENDSKLAIALFHFASES
ncbi:MAG: hypothetical protein ACTSSM_16050 [Promethearchaeota archaeon]